MFIFFLFFFRFIQINSMSECSLKGLYLGESIPELFSLPTSLEFTRDYVAKNLPVVIRGATAEWPACKKWNSRYFR